jgi:uncharacterized protein YbjT (DUF2867 family)
MNLVLGASGTVGSRVAGILLDRGHPVRVVSRDPAKLAALAQRGATAVQGDLRNADWMGRALDGVTTLLLSTHGLVPPSRSNHPGLIDGAGNQRMIDAAAKAGVPHIVFVSAMSGADSPALFGRVKFQTEQHLRQYSNISHTIIRPTVFIETHAVLLLAEPLRARGSAVLLGPSTTKLNWISAADVASYIVEQMTSRTPAQRTVVIGGPDNLSRLEVLAIIEEVLGGPARRRHIPIGVIRAMNLVAGSVHPGLRYLLDMVIAEVTLPDHPVWVPPHLDWTGTTTVRAVVQQWAQDKLKGGNS